MAIKYQWAVYQYEDGKIKTRQTASTYNRCMKLKEALDDAQVALEAFGLDARVKAGNQVDYGFALVRDGVIDTVTNGDKPRKVPVKFQIEIDGYNPMVSAGQPKKKPTKVLSIRLESSLVSLHKIDSKWLLEAANDKLNKDN